MAVIRTIAAEAGSLSRRDRPWGRRAILLALIALPVGAALALTEPGAAYRADPELATLLKSMALIKLAFAGPMAALAWWRLGIEPLSPVQTGSYLGVVSMAFTALALVFSLSAVPAGSILFHLAMISFAVLALTDGGIKQAINRTLLRGR